MLALRRRRRGRAEHRARPPRDLRLAGRADRGLRRVPRRRAGSAVVGARAARGPATSSSPPEDLTLRARRLALRAGAGTTCAWPCRARTTRATPRRRWRPARLAGADEAARGRRAGGLRGRRAAVRAPGRARRRARPVVDDYAHHPTEVAATIAAARSLQPRRLVAVFQPHLFSRTQRAASRVRRRAGRRRRRRRPRRLPGPRARGGLPGRQRQADRRGGRRRAPAAARCMWLPTIESAQQALAPRLRDGDLVLVLGAGDIDRLGRALVAG